ncbi:MAG TPA: DUF2637 domain-containing protein, partial [Streptosporangiaceae bacterium]|nr:DUF2637 domain-containing protein [Streptosporangiaceae bacterium]
MARRRDQRAAGQAGPSHDQTATVAVGQHRRVEPGGENGGQVLRLLALIAIAGGVIALTAGACVLSYTSVHDLAVQSGVSVSLARIYPGVADAMLVIAGCAVLALRGAGLISKIYAWLCFVILLAAIAAGSALRPAGVHVPKRWAEVTAAIFPWALVLVAFGLLLALLRHSRRRRRVTEAAATARAADAVPPAGLVPPAGPTPPILPPPPAPVPPAVAPVPSVPSAAEGPRPAQSGPAQPVAQGAGPGASRGTFEPGALEPGTFEPGALEPGTLEPGTFEPGGWRVTTVEPEPASADHEPESEPADGSFDPITHEATTRRSDTDPAAPLGSLSPDHPSPTSQTAPRDRPAPLFATDLPPARPDQPATAEAGIGTADVGTGIADAGTGTGWPTEPRPAEPSTSPWLTRPPTDQPPSAPPSSTEPP